MKTNMKICNPTNTQDTIIKINSSFITNNAGKYNQSKPQTTTSINNSLSTDIIKNNSLNITNTPTTSSSNSNNTYNSNEIDTIDLDNYTNELTTSSESIEEEKKNTFGQNIMSFIGGLLGEFSNLGEGVIDSHIYGTTKTINALGAKRLFKLNDNYDDKIIGYDVSEKIENGITKNVNKKENGWHKTGAFIGRIGGYMSLSSVPYVGKALTTFAGAGVKTENAYSKAINKEEDANEWKVLLESFIGSLGGFAAGYSKSSAAANVIKKNGMKNIATGAKNMFTQNGIGKGIVSFLKSTGPVFKNAGIASLKSPATITQTGAKVGETVVSIIDGEGTGVDSAGDAFGKIPVRFWDNLGEAGLNYFVNYK